MKRKYMLLFLGVLLLVIFCKVTYTSLQPIYYGKWVVTRDVATSHIFGLSDEEIKAFFQKELYFAKNVAKFDQDKNVCKNPLYTQRILTADGFWDEFRAQIKNLGINADQVTFYTICSKPDEDWDSFGEFFIVKDKNTLIAFWQGVFFELKRTK